MVFVKGRSPGRPPGATGKRTRLYRESIEKHLPAILDLVVQRALDGDGEALKMIWQSYRPDGNLGAYIEPREGKFDPEQASVDVLIEMLEGHVTPADAGRMLSAIAAHQTTITAAKDKELIDKIIEGENK
jgi:hypothetical protein